LGTIYIPAKKAKTAIKLAASKKGFRYLKNEIPELKMAITSVLLASLEVNQITDKNKK